MVTTGTRFSDAPTRPPRLARRRVSRQSEEQVRARQAGFWARIPFFIPAADNRWRRAMTLQLGPELPKGLMNSLPGTRFQPPISLRPAAPDSGGTETADRWPPQAA